MLRLSKLTDYGTVVLAGMAQAPEQTYTAAGLAKSTYLPTATVRKLLKLLTHGKVLNSRRGAQGGYTLARSPRNINAVEIIDAIEGPFSITECAGHPGMCGLEPVCAVGHNWQRINLSIRAALCDITLDQLARPIAPPVTRIRMDQISRPNQNKEEN